MTETQKISEALVVALMDAAVDGIIVIDANASIRLFNKGAEQLFGYNASEVVGHNVKVLMPEPFRAEHDGYMSRYINTGEKRIIGIGREVRALTKNGEEFPIDLAVGEAAVEGEKLFVGILRDLRQRTQLESLLDTERQQVNRLERSLTHVQRINTLGEMTAGIAHEVNQPLAAISTYADAGQRLLDRETPDLNKLGQALERIGQQARRAGDVVRKMRDLARYQEAPREVRQINELILDLMELVKLEARECDATIHLRLGDDLPPTAVDSIQIQQVILNLVRNGLEAMVKHSQATLGLTIATRLEKDKVEVSVTDRGIGIPPEKAESIFQPFETSKPSGMGIGLSICSTIIERHGGRLWYEPVTDGGSRFLFTLPIHQD